jgi:predicted nucleic acid-binding protein
VSGSLSAPVAGSGPLLLDTNVLLALALPTHHNAAQVRPAVASLEEAGVRLCVSPQSLVEFYAVVTRPRDAAPPGPGWKAAGALAALSGLEARFELLPDDPAIFARWRVLAAVHHVIAKSSHDARIAAFCLVYGTGLLTANARHFARFASDGLIIVKPARVLAEGTG